MGLRVHYLDWREAIRAVATTWNTTFNGSNRLLFGTDTKDDVIVDADSKGAVLKSPNGHYWRLTVDNTGAITTNDLGTDKP